MTASVPAWEPGPQRPRASRDAVHVWRAALDVEPAVLAQLRASLAPDERARAGRFHFAHDRDRYEAGRGILRDVLGRYLDVPPAALAFNYGPQGKPDLESPSGTGFTFNVSHAGGVLLVAIGRDRPLGVDVERDRERVSLDLAARFFSPAEVAALLRLPEHERRQAFLACWTRKEAYIKARGEGLSLPLDRFDVSLRPGDPARLLADRGDPGAADAWELRALPVPPGQAAALAALGRGWRLRLWDWQAGTDRPAGADAIG